MSLFTELKRRNVFRMAALYAVAGWLIMQVAEVVITLAALPVWTGQALLALLAVGFPIALVFSWFYELTPEGISLEKDIETDKSITHLTGRRMNFIVMSLLCAAVLLFAFDKWWLRDTATPAGYANSVAVLAFDDLSPGGDQSWFSDGLSEEIINSLAQLPELKVTARTSSFFFKGKDMHTAQIADMLNVSHLLEGSVRREGDRLRITAQLIDAQSGTHVWSKNYDRDLGSIFAIQDDVANSIAAALIDSFKGLDNKRSEHTATTDLSAYDNYLRGLEQQAIYSFSSLDVAEDYFKQALARDPGFTDARLSLVRNYLHQYSTGMIDIDQTRTATEPLLRQVRETEPDNRLARALELTRELMDFDPSDNADDVEAAADELQSLLLELPTETFSRIKLANSLQYDFGNEQQAFELLQAGLLVDPLEAELHRRLGWLYTDIGDLEQALASLQRAIELAPDNPNNYIATSRLEKELDNLPGALEWLRQATLVDKKDHGIAAMLAHDFYDLRLPEEGDYWLARVQVLAPGSDLARSLEVDRAVAREDKERVIALASALIADQIETHGGAYGNSLAHYVQTMMEDDRAEEAYVFLASVRPEITQYDQIPSDIKGLITQYASIVAMSGFETFENRRAAWNAFSDRRDELGHQWKKNPESGNFTMNYLMNGEFDQAVDHFLEYELNVPVSKDLKMHRKPNYALFAPIYEDERVAVRLIERAERFAELREDVRAMLQQPEWSTP